jgi:hypothetical protein
LIFHRCWLRRDRCSQSARLWYGRWQWGGAFIQSPLNLYPFVNSTRHHAGTGKERIVNGVGGYESISISKGDVNHDKIMNVTKLFLNLVCSYLAGNPAYDEIPRGSTADLV